MKLNQETEGEAVYKRSLVSPMVMFSFVITIVGCQTAIEVKRFQWVREDYVNNLSQFRKKGEGRKFESEFRSLPRHWYTLGYNEHILKPSWSFYHTKLTWLWTKMASHKLFVITVFNCISQTHWKPCRRFLMNREDIKAEKVALSAFRQLNLATERLNRRHSSIVELGVEFFLPPEVRIAWPEENNNNTRFDRQFENIISHSRLSHLMTTANASYSIRCWFLQVH